MLSHVQATASLPLELMPTPSSVECPETREVSCCLTNCLSKAMGRAMENPLNNTIAMAPGLIGTLNYVKCPRLKHDLYWALIFYIKLTRFSSGEARIRYPFFL